MTTHNGSQIEHDGSRWIEYRPLADLPEAIVNPKDHDIQGIVASIRQFDFTEPGPLDERTGRLLHGHGRKAALEHMHAKGMPAPDGIHATDTGDWLVPLVRGWSSRDDDHAHAAALALNRHTEQGGWKNDELFALLDQLAATNQDLMHAAGFGDEDYEHLLADLEHDHDPTYKHHDPPLGPNTTPYTDPGDPPASDEPPNTAEHGHNRALVTQQQIVLTYSGDTHAWVIDQLTNLGAHHGTHSLADTLVKLIEDATGHTAP